MRRVLAIVSILAVAVPASAQPKPNTLTPREITDGWILLFDGATTFGWHAYGGNGKPVVKDNALELDGVGTIQTNAHFSDFDVSFEYFLKAGLASATVDNAAQKKGMLMSFDKTGEWTPFTVRVSEGLLHFESEGRPLKMKWEFSSRFGFVPTKDPLKLRNIKLRPINTKPLFNGKNLDGWRVFPGKKSTFAVINGAINVKDGPGDLQTTNKYQDFVLQLDCISNGKHLNSGIFFRCRENEYQNGYEAQIRNEFKADASQKYLIEEYDPKTNKLVGKKEQLFSAVDFGTGAIYRRQPARKQMSKDGEWFGLTIVANGNHVATWVNGVQVTDWHDHRPKSDNARTGCKLEAGHISIQGHDPTTDLSFKNFRIAELPK